MDNLPLNRRGGKFIISAGTLLMGSLALIAEVRSWLGYPTDARDVIFYGFALGLFFALAIIADAINLLAEQLRLDRLQSKDSGGNQNA